jgi:hypothetical protein
MARKLLQVELARDLDISPSMVTRLKARGMPTHSVAVARAWRSSHLDPTMVKSIRQPRKPMRAARKGGTLIGERSDRTGKVWTKLEAETALGLIKAFAAHAAVDFDGWCKPLRHTMRLLPVAWWDQVDLDDELWDKLIGEDFLAMLAEIEGSLSEEDKLREPTADEFLLENWPYLRACGLLQMTVPDDTNTPAIAPQAA